MVEVKERHFISLQGWMLTKLGLSGDDLLVYGIIYGFSQKEGHAYTGGVEYLQEWLGKSSRNTITDVLNHLEERKFIIKKKVKNKNTYYINDEILDDVESAKNQDSSENESANIQESNPEKIMTESAKNQDSYNISKDILSYLNEISKKAYKITDSNNQKGIRKLLKEGYVYDDFIKVIDYKWKIWGEKPYRFSTGTISSSMIDPKILFGKNFNRYLTEANSQPTVSYGKSVSRPVDEDVSDEVF